MGNVIPFNIRKRYSQEKQSQTAILDYFHCKKCLDELPDDTSPAEYQMIEVGGTEQGIQVWCKRHEINIIHIDFEGQSMTAIP